MRIDHFQFRVFLIFEGRCFIIDIVRRVAILPLHQCDRLQFFKYICCLCQQFSILIFMVQNLGRLNKFGQQAANGGIVRRRIVDMPPVFAGMRILYLIGTACLIPTHPLYDKLHGTPHIIVVFFQQFLVLCIFINAVHIFGHFRAGAVNPTYILIVELCKGR